MEHTDQFIGNTNPDRISGTIELEPDNSRPFFKQEKKILGEIHLDEDSQAEPKKEYKEITLKFTKGLVGEEFEAKDGNIYREIKIPNVDKDDKSPWLSFVAPANKIHEDSFSENGIWLKLPAEGHTTVKREFIAYTDSHGKNEYQKETASISNTDLKKLMDEARPKERVSLKDKIAQKKETLAETIDRRINNPVNRNNMSL